MFTASSQVAKVNESIRALQTTGCLLIITEPRRHFEPIFFYSTISIQCTISIRCVIMYITFVPESKFWSKRRKKGSKLRFFMSNPMYVSWQKQLILEPPTYISYIYRYQQYPGIHQLYLLYLQVEIVSWNPSTISPISIGRNSILEPTNYISYIQVEIVSWNPPTISPISIGINSILESTNYISYIQVEIVSWNPPTISPISRQKQYPGTHQLYLLYLWLQDITPESG